MSTVESNGEPIWGVSNLTDWVQTATGLKFHPSTAKGSDFRIDDIAHSLSQQCRFTGHTRKFLSIAEHSVRVCGLVMDRCPYTQDWNPLYNGLTGRRIAFAALMHDASEAYLTDLARPIKASPALRNYCRMEDDLMHRIADHFDFAWPMPTIVKDADNTLLATEARDLMSPVTENWHLKYPMLHDRIRPWSPRKAKRKFLNLFYRLNTRGIQDPRRWF